MPFINRNDRGGTRPTRLMRGESKQRIGPVGSLLMCLLLFGVGSSFAQDLGEVARRERARKQSQPRKAMRVLTEDDLARPRILTPQERAHFEAAQKNWVPPSAVQATEVSAGESEPAEVPLGDIARRYRLQKQIRQRHELVELPPLTDGPTLASPTFSKLPSTSAPAPRSDLARPHSVRAARPVKDGEPRTVVDVPMPRGGSLWKLAEQFLGHGSQWPRLAALNPQIHDPHRIRVGSWIRLPLDVSASQPLKQFRVQRGDTLWKVARAEFGTGQAWSCIARANRQIRNADLIYPGQTLLIPTVCTARP